MVKRFSYDAWGKRRLENWQSTEEQVASEVGRIGFTGHEMLDELGLIHMNGRVYDPTIGRFLSADPFIQDDWFGTQAFNRYSYVQNNPLSYTDPTGYYIPKDTSESADREQERHDFRNGDNDDRDDDDRDRADSATTNQKELSYGNQPDFIDGYNKPPNPEAAAAAASLIPVVKFVRVAAPFVGKLLGPAFSKLKGVLGFSKKVEDVANKGLGSTRKGVRNYLNNIEGVPRKQLAKDLENSGFKKVFDGNNMQHFQRGKWKVRLDPPHGKTGYNHMHINRGGNKNSFDKNLKPVSHKSLDAHIPIQ